MLNASGVRYQMLGYVISWAASMRNAALEHKLPDPILIHHIWQLHRPILGESFLFNLVVFLGMTKEQRTLEYIIEVM